LYEGAFARFAAFLGELLQSLPEVIVRAMHFGTHGPVTDRQSGRPHAAEHPAAHSRHWVLKALALLSILFLLACGGRTPEEASAKTATAAVIPVSLPPDGTVASTVWELLHRTAVHGPILHTASAPAEGVKNDPPKADFQEKCGALACSFSDRSSDPDGSIVGWLWEFDGGETSTERDPQVEYAAAGDRFVRLTVLDDKGATSSATRWIFVPNVDLGIVLSASDAAKEGVLRLELSWEMDEVLPVELRRNGRTIHFADGLTRNWVDVFEDDPGSAHVYQVCVAASNVCSNEVAVGF